PFASLKGKLGSCGSAALPNGKTTRFEQRILRYSYLVEEIREVLVEKNNSSSADSDCGWFSSGRGARNRKANASVSCRGRGAAPSARTVCWTLQRHARLYRPDRAHPGQELYGLPRQRHENG